MTKWELTVSVCELIFRGTAATGRGDTFSGTARSYDRLLVVARGCFFFSVSRAFREIAFFFSSVPPSRYISDEGNDKREWLASLPLVSPHIRGMVGVLSAMAAFSGMSIAITSGLIRDSAISAARAAGSPPLHAPPSTLKQIA